MILLVKKIHLITYSFLAEQKDLITQIYQHSETNNLRLLKRAILSFEYLSKLIGFPKAKEDRIENIKRELLFYILAFYFEFKRGKIDDKYYSPIKWQDDSSKVRDYVEENGKEN